jgi:hypothetical protein
MSRRLLQIVNITIALLTIFLATMSIIFGVNSPIYSGTEIPMVSVLDSNLRFFGGLGLGLGLALLWITPSVEKQTILFRILWFCAFLGGIGRIISMIVAGYPPMSMMIFTFIEVPLVPVLIYWQWKISLKPLSTSYN